MQIIDHRFVEFIPEQKEMEDGVIYVSLEYGTAVHNCMCGCGEQVVTPFSPTDWKMNYDGESISLHPSIGNWDFPCRSHYWISENKIIWAEQWSDQKVRSGREADEQVKEKFYNHKQIKKEKTLFHKIKLFLHKILFN